VRDAPRTRTSRTKCQLFSSLPTPQPDFVDQRLAEFSHRVRPAATVRFGPGGDADGVHQLIEIGVAVPLRGALPAGTFEVLRFIRDAV
jgi:hypothetical protein